MKVSGTEEALGLRLRLCPWERESIPDPLASAQIFKFS